MWCAVWPSQYIFRVLVFFNDTATTEIYTLSLHDALPILLTPDVADMTFSGVLLCEFSDRRPAPAKFNTRPSHKAFKV